MGAAFVSGDAFTIIFGFSTVTSSIYGFVYKSPLFPYPSHNGLNLTFLTGRLLESSSILVQQQQY